MPPASDQATEKTWQPAENREGKPTRRNILGLGVAGLGGAGACALAVPFLDSLNNPDSALKNAASHSPVLDIDLSDLPQGGSKTVIWQNLPVFIQHRTTEMIAALHDPALRSMLRDPDSTTRQQPADAVNPCRSVMAEYGIFISICTHLGCIIRPSALPQSPVPGGHFSGFLCPCHGSQFDNAGRVLRDMPAPVNLPVPPLYFLSPAKIRLGESKGESGFHLDNIRQL